MHDCSTSEVSVVRDDIIFLVILLYQNDLRRDHSEDKKITVVKTVCGAALY